MSTQTTEGTGPGSVDRVLPKIVNGIVKDVNIAKNALDTYRGLVIVDAAGEEGDTYQLTGNMVSTGSIETMSDLTVGGNVDVEGNVEVMGYVRGHLSGQYLNTSFYTFTAGNVANSSNSYTDVANVGYTPVSDSSYLLIEYHAPYTVSGSQGDDFRSRITVNGTEITYRDQLWTNASGGGTRSVVVFPISMVYANSVTSTLIVKVSVARNGADDTLTVNTNSAYLRITEVAR